MKKVNIEILEIENDYLSSSLRNIRSQINVGKKLLSENQKKYNDLFPNSDKKLDSLIISARFIERLFFLVEGFPSATDEKYMDFVNSVVSKKYPTAKLDEILGVLMVYPDFIKRLQSQKKKIGKKYYKNFVKINKCSR